MNIVVLSTLYPDPLDRENANTTPVVHKFAKEWVKQGHNVLVIHNLNIFVLPLYYIPERIWSILSSKVGFKINLNRKQRKDYYFKKDNVDVERLTIIKIVPFGKYLNISLNNQYKRLLKVLKKHEFTPDIVIGHAENPQIYQLYRMKDDYKNIKTSLVFHGVEYLKRKSYTTWRNEYFNTIDKIGFRNKDIYRKACEEIGFNREYFICPSGISEKIIPTKVPNKILVNKKMKIIYVGQLIKRKHVDKIIKVLTSLNNCFDFECEIIGDGEELEALKDIANKTDLKNNIAFLGRLQHKEVIKKMLQANLFIMISEGEAFGLVYLEAMSQGCIAIASKDSGMEDIIQNGVNGYLCDSGNASELNNILLNIKQLNDLEVISLINNSYNTSKKFTDEYVARQYLKNVTDI